jgi:thiamine biosynthesis lipoprotein
MRSLTCLSIGTLLVLTSCERNAFHKYSRESTAMDTYMSVTIYDPGIEPQRADALIDSAFNEIRRIEKVMTDYADTSEVGIVNRSAGKDTVVVSAELGSLLHTSISYSEQSGGAFDVTVGPLVKAWDFLSSEPEIPSRSKIRVLRQLVGYKKLGLGNNTLFLSERGMRIDLGAIAKGYAVDKALDVLKRNGVQNVIVDLGGNLGVWWKGTHAFDSPVAEILIRHPRKEGKFFGSLNVGTCGVSTSGDYQRYFMKDGVRYHHILDPATGYPARDVVSVTIIAEDATAADALSTLVFVLGRTKGMDFITHNKGIEGVIVWEEGGKLSYALSPGLEHKFKRSND